MKSTKMARIIAVGAVLSALVGCEYYGPEKETSVVKESDSTSTATESQGSSETVEQIEARISDQIESNTAESQTVIKDLKSEVQSLKDQLAAEAAEQAAAVEAVTIPETVSPTDVTPETPTQERVPSAGFQVADVMVVAKKPIAISGSLIGTDPDAPQKPEEKTVADLGLKTGDPVIVNVNKGDDRAQMAKGKSNQRLNCSDLEGGDASDGSNRLVVIGFKVKSPRYGDYLGSQEDWTGTNENSMIANSGTRNIRHLSLICGKIGKAGVTVNDPLFTKEVGSDSRGNGDYGFKDFQPEEEPVGDAFEDYLENSYWGIVNDLGNSWKNKGSAAPNTVMTGIKLRVFQAKKSAARGDNIEEVEGGDYELADDNSQIDYDDEIKDGVYRYWSDKHTPTNGKVIQSMKFFGAKLNPVGDPSIVKSNDDSLFDYRDGAFEQGEWLPGVGKGDATKGFYCPRNHAITGVNVRSNWFYGIVWVDSIECKEIVPLYQD